MLRKAEFKKRGKSAFYRNWKSCIAICILNTILVGGTLISFKNNYDPTPSNIKSLNISKINAETNSDIVNEFINGITGNQPAENIFLSKATRGVIGSISNNISKTGSFLFGILNAINQALFKDRIWASVIIIIGALLSLFYWIFVAKVLEVGRARFFLENRKYTKTKANKIAFSYKLKKTTHIAYTMFLKNLYTILWFPTIIGGFNKYYAYHLVPYILAENPNLKTKDILKLSAKMMEGYKWEMFKLDLSFIGWGLLGIITANVSNLVFTTPYIDATKAEVYMYLRDLAKTRGIKNASALNDIHLEGEIVFEEYPLYEYEIKENKFNKIFNINYKRDYTFWDIILLFFCFSFIGWIWEVLFCLFQNGNLINKGTLYGPWLPIYGGGAIAMLVLLKKVRKNPLVYFILAMFICGIIEYCTSIYLELVHGMAWWDYTGFYLNINGRVCLEGLLLFGFGGLVVTYLAAPLITNILDRVKKGIKMFLSVTLVLIIALDFYISGKKPNSGEGITTNINEIKENKTSLKEGL